MDRQRQLGLRDQASLRIGNGRRVVVALLDVGGEGALLDGDPGLVVDRLEAVPDDLEGDGVERGALAPGAVLTGPLVVTQFDATTLVPPGSRLSVDASGSLLIEVDA